MAFGFAPFPVATRSRATTSMVSTPPRPSNDENKENEPPAKIQIEPVFEEPKPEPSRTLKTKIFISKNDPDRSLAVHVFADPACLRIEQVELFAMRLRDLDYTGLIVIHSPTPLPHSWHMHLESLSNRFETSASESVIASKMLLDKSRKNLFVRLPSIPLKSPMELFDRMEGCGRIPSNINFSNSEPWLGHNEPIAPGTPLRDDFVYTSGTHTSTPGQPVDWKAIHPRFLSTDFASTGIHTIFVATDREFENQMLINYYMNRYFFS